MVGPDLSDKRVTAWFDDESLDEVVSAVCLLVAAPCRITDEAVIIGSQAPGGDR